MTNDTAPRKYRRVLLTPVALPSGGADQRHRGLEQDGSALICTDGAV